MVHDARWDQPTTLAARPAHGVLTQEGCAHQTPLAGLVEANLGIKASPCAPVIAVNERLMGRAVARLRKHRGTPRISTWCRRAARHRKYLQKDAKHPQIRLGFLLDAAAPRRATVQQICKTTGSQAHTVRSTCADAFKKKLGLTLRSEKVESGEQVYWIDWPRDRPESFTNGWPARLRPIGSAHNNESKSTKLSNLPDLRNSSPWHDAWNQTSS
jgi:hypothetical protein